MGVSSDGQICYGIPFEEEYEFPWSSEKWDGDEEEWWLYEVCQYKNPFELYDENGEYINGIEPTKEEIDRYYSARNELKKSHPMPVKLEIFRSYNYPMYIVAVPRTCIRCVRGDAIQFNPDTMKVTEEERQSVIDFCEKYCRPSTEYQTFPIMDPNWYLTSLYG